MLCMSCKKREAEYVLYDEHSNRFEAICEKCLNEYIQYFGELEATFWSLPLSDEDLQGILMKVNNELRYWERRYHKVLGELLEVKAGE